VVARPAHCSRTVNYILIEQGMQMSGVCTLRPNLSTVRTATTVVTTKTTPMMTEERREESWPMPRLLKMTGA
jgi:hypothetical protein